ncbi:hypothetical protein QLX67_00615 [Balneolaceae bacterium ANBcel3]|nr:hypothetical protein [Balneolaceae bacterium ANBcel3]
MSETGAQLGINLDANKLFYAVSTPDTQGVLSRIGSVDFSFDLIDSLTYRDPERLSGISNTVQKIIREHGVKQVHFLTPPGFECWSILPRSVFDIEDERRAHLNVLTQGTRFERAAAKWHELSNRDFRLLSLSREEQREALHSMADKSCKTRLFSEFEVSKAWLNHIGTNGSYLVISACSRVVTVTSFLLGKLRAATFIKLEDIHDLPYLWLQYASHLPWMKGFHDNIWLYGSQSDRIMESLKPYIDPGSEIAAIDRLETMNMNCSENTFSFSLERAFASIILAGTPCES